jgi:hypothetical protein
MGLSIFALQSAAMLYIACAVSGKIRFLVIYDDSRNSDKFFRLLCRAKYPSGELVLANERLRSYMLPGALDRVQSESWCPPLQR